ncbi:hypothetical protein KTO58_16235 [Chitinophaga pendula]|uniref:hypothetical protein n=1 Tax=Chitinophaga TaxID=79328 RepID=UPI000BAFD57F|nr:MULTISPECIES: hypothetical protein [Chitinophaga]ASZ11740.1 hypothetical protein CK934_12615 [Chitinophaga sp. MD30]UCJ05241.1 hypothetical protein KTO58_16235 [Chitinophaga pendula]
MKMTALSLLAASMILFACKKDDKVSTSTGINGKWKMQQNTRITYYPDRKDTSRYNYQSADYWNFIDNKIARSMNSNTDTVYYTVIANNSKLVTASDPEFIFRVDTFEIKSLDRAKLELVLRAQSFGTAALSYETTFSFTR